MDDLDSLEFRRQVNLRSKLQEVKLRKPHTLFILMTICFLCSATMPAAAGSKIANKTRIAKGKKLFAMNGCFDCHRIGSKGCDEGVSLDGLGKRRSRSFVLAHLRDPEAHVARNKQAFRGEPNLMPTPNLSEKEIKLIVDYLRCLPLPKSR